MLTAITFPGQGAQAPGMGEPWRGHAAWALVDRVEAALGEPLGWLLLTAPQSVLDRTREAQLSVFLTSLMAWEAVRERLPAPTVFAGHSLGQLTALVAAGALELEAGAKLVARRAEATQQAADRHPGCMAALLGATPEQAMEAAAAAGGCWMANDNAPGQVVIAGTPAGVEAATEGARSMGVRRVMPLRVGGAFHTPLMTEATAALAGDLYGATFGIPNAPVVANTDAMVHHDHDGWASRLIEHLVQPVLWRQSVLTMAQMGVDSFVEVGPGGVLSGLARRTVAGAEARHIASPEDVPDLVEAR